MSTLLGVGTNRVIAFEEHGKLLIRKEPAIDECTLSPFWRMMRTVFRWSFDAVRSSTPQMCALLQKNPYCVIPSFVRQEKNALIFSRLQGYAWEPDAFPDSETVSVQLGQFLAWNHLQHSSGWGPVGQASILDPHPGVMSALETGVRRWTEDDPLHHRVRELARSYAGRDLPYSETGLIMTDLSANQFVFDGDRLSGCVDLDAVVFGPVAWDLALAEVCVSHRDAFRRGYETVRPYPDNCAARRFYRFLLLLQDESPDRREMRSFLEEMSHPG